MLHDCGKYISLINVADSSFNIIMSSEIIGLSHAEREIIAHVVRFNTMDFEYYGDSPVSMTLTRAEYMTVAKLSAILTMVNALDRSHHQKITGLRTVIKDGRLILNVEHKGDFTLETEYMSNKARFFEEIFSIKPVLKLKKKI
jgi:exopolyphosphatase/guanosine-5'-triphosphate,3'-diphosphate pyrophosphatase